MKTRLSEILALVRYTPEQPPHHRSNLIRSILMFAELNDDDELAQACYQEMRDLQEAANVEQ